jgi:phosphohistidine phosphatase
MKILYLARHAKSSWDDYSVRDIDRSLNARGLRDAPFMGALLAGMKEMPEVILASPAQRTITTARLLAGAMGLPEDAVAAMQPLYAASAETILGVVREIDDGISRAMVVGHNPGMAQLAGDLAPGSVTRMPTCAVASFELPVDSWTLARAGKARLRFFETPKMHPERR